mmetsp:Transcript_10688/g.13990  ORF Transcript_10688/g.13990 Transcript_10688/m.13990 type:complete len:322 (-) Transcript_10688:69-1034(-)
MISERVRVQSQRTTMMAQIKKYNQNPPIYPKDHSIKEYYHLHALHLAPQKVVNVLRNLLMLEQQRLFFPLSENFRTQDDPTYCGISTLVMCLNALSIDPERVWKGIWRWFAEDMLECCISLEEVREKGTTLEQIAHLARCNGAKTPISGGKSHGILRGNELTVETLRSIVREICRLGPWCKRINNYENCQGGDKNCIGPCDGADFCDQDSKQPGIIIVSYSRKTLGQTGDGHFSPVAAFHEPSDSCLIMDVARFKYPPYWISIQTLYDAIQPIDSTTKKPRGIILLCQGGGIWEPKVCQDSDFKVEQEEYDCKICPVPRPL